MPFIYQQEVGSMLYCEHNCLSLPSIQVFPKFLYTLPVLCRYN